MEKIKCGIFGLNKLIDGGFNRGSVTVVIGASGAGKTTFAIQFIRRGLVDGQECVFVSLDESKDQIIQEAFEFGWREITDYLDQGKLVFIDASGKDFAAFIKNDLPAFVSKWKGADSRIAIDPLTPVIWSAQSKYEQRELLLSLFKLSKNLGTVLCTLEEHPPAGRLTGEETVTPMYLVDCIIHLQYLPLRGKETRRDLQIVKCRNSRHSEFRHPYIILRGLGMIVDSSTYAQSGKTTLVKELTKRLESDLEALQRDKKRLIIQLLSTVMDDDFKSLQLESIFDGLKDDYGSK